MSLYTYLTGQGAAYVSHIANMHNAAIMLHGQIDLSFLHVSAKTQSTAMSIWYVIVMYVPTINMPWNATYAN